MKRARRRRIGRMESAGLGTPREGRLDAMDERRTFPDARRPWEGLSREYSHRKPWPIVRQHQARLPAGAQTGEGRATEHPDARRDPAVSQR